MISDAGHLVPANQPEASLELFRRAIAGLDIASGRNLVSEQTELPLIPDNPVHPTSSNRGLGQLPDLSFLGPEM